MIRENLDGFEENLIKEGWTKILNLKVPKKFNFEMLKIVHQLYQYKSDPEICEEIYSKFNVKINRNTLRTYRQYLGWSKNKKAQIYYKKGFEDGVNFEKERQGVSE